MRAGDVGERGAYFLRAECHFPRPCDTLIKKQNSMNTHESDVGVSELLRIILSGGSSTHLIDTICKPFFDSPVGAVGACRAVLALYVAGVSALHKREESETSRVKKRRIEYDTRAQSREIKRAVFLSFTRYSRQVPAKRFPVNTSGRAENAALSLFRVTARTRQYIVAKCAIVEWCHDKSLYFYGQNAHRLQRMALEEKWSERIVEIRESRNAFVFVAPSADGELSQYAIFYNDASCKVHSPPFRASSVLCCSRFEGDPAFFVEWFRGQGILRHWVYDEHTKTYETREYSSPGVLFVCEDTKEGSIVAVKQNTVVVFQENAQRFDENVHDLVHTRILIGRGDNGSTSCLYEVGGDRFVGFVRGNQRRVSLRENAPRTELIKAVYQTHNDIVLILYTNPDGSTGVYCSTRLAETVFSNVRALIATDGYVAVHCEKDVYERHVLYNDMMYGSFSRMSRTFLSPCVLCADGTLSYASEKQHAETPCMKRSPGTRTTWLSTYPEAIMQDVCDIAFFDRRGVFVLHSKRGLFYMDIERKTQTTVADNAWRIEADAETMRVYTADGRVHIHTRGDAITPLPIPRIRSEKLILTNTFPSEFEHEIDGSVWKNSHNIPMGLPAHVVEVEASTKIDTATHAVLAVIIEGRVVLHYIDTQNMRILKSTSNTIDLGLDGDPTVFYVIPYPRFFFDASASWIECIDSEMQLQVVCEHFTSTNTLIYGDNDHDDLGGESTDVTELFS